MCSMECHSEVVRGYRIRCNNEVRGESSVCIVPGLVMNVKDVNANGTNSLTLKRGFHHLIPHYTVALLSHVLKRH